VFGVDVGVVAFLDGGDVTSTAAEMDLDNLNWATGGGLRIPTPIGAVRIDLGYRLNRKRAEDPEPYGLLWPFAFHFGIGEAY
jgi:outer membrane translocation and assembly module TamA